MKAKKSLKRTPSGSADISWDRQLEFEAIQAESRIEARKAVALAKKLGWRPAKAK